MIYYLSKKLIASVQFVLNKSVAAIIYLTVLFYLLINSSKLFLGIDIRLNLASFLDSHVSSSVVPRAKMHVAI